MRKLGQRIKNATSYKQAHSEALKPIMMPYIIKTNLKSPSYWNELVFVPRRNPTLLLTNIKRFVNATFLKEKLQKFHTEKLQSVFLYVQTEEFFFFLVFCTESLYIIDLLKIDQVKILPIELYLKRRFLGISLTYKSNCLNNIKVKGNRKHRNHVIKTIMLIHYENP